MAQTPKDKQAHPRRGGWTPVANEAGQAALAAFARAGFSDPTLVLRWAEIAGPEVARLAQPLKFSEDARGGVLTLKAEPGAALFLQHETRALAERINAYLGRPAVQRLRFVQGALATRPPPPKPRAVAKLVPPGDPATGYLGPEKLGNALIRLAAARRGPGQNSGN